MVGGSSFMPGLSLESPSAPAPRKDASAKKKAKRRSQEGPRPTTGSMFSEAAKRAAEVPGAKLPEQRPGESLRHYSMRLNRAVAEELKPVNRKLVTDNAREKRRERAEVKRKKAAEKVLALQERKASAFQQPKVAFGEVAQRPPFRKEMLKKPQAKAAAAGTKRPRDLGEYAAQVRQAYSTLKKKRQFGQS